MADYDVDVTIIAADLSDSNGLALVEACIADIENLTLLVNNAGFGTVGDFSHNAIVEQEAMIRVHVLATVRLTRAALSVMLSQDRGAIINVSSVVAFYPMSGNVTYSATKSYLNAFTESLHQELTGTGVRVQALCPGFTRTEFQESAQIPTAGLPGFLWMSPEQVVEKSLRDLEKGRVLSVPGWGYRVITWLSGLIPRQILYLMGRWVRELRAGPREI
jgi:short-subunit dehydrogenase